MLKIILADNQAIFRAGAAKVLAVEDEVRVMAQAQSADQMMMALEKFRPNLLIFAAALQADLKVVAAQAARSKTRLVVIAENGEQPARYLGAGLHGMVYRNIGGQALVDCVHKVAGGENWVQDMRAPSEIVSENDFVGARVRDRLTPKELRIVALIVQGFKNKEIAKQLGTTEQVIKNYLRNVYDKIGVSDRLELALFTVHHRILAEAAAATAAAHGTPPQPAPPPTEARPS
jgi:DNA-binding NarL/FixJ family response regulator